MIPVTFPSSSRIGTKPDLLAAGHEDVRENNRVNHPLSVIGTSTFA